MVISGWKTKRKDEEEGRGEGTERQGIDVQEDDVVGGCVARQDPALDGGPVGDGFVWVDVFAGGFAEEGFEHGLDLGGVGIGG